MTEKDRDELKLLLQEIQHYFVKHDKILGNLKFGNGDGFKSAIFWERIQKVLSKL